MSKPLSQPPLFSVINLKLLASLTHHTDITLSKLLVDKYVLVSLQLSRKVQISQPQTYSGAGHLELVHSLSKHVVNCIIKTWDNFTYRK